MYFKKFNFFGNIRHSFFILLFAILVPFETLKIHKDFNDCDEGCRDYECDSGATCSPVTNDCDCEPFQCSLKCEFWAKNEKLCNICRCAKSCANNQKCPKDQKCNEMTKLCVPIHEDLCMAALECKDEKCPPGERCNEMTNICEIPASSISCKEDKDCPETYLCSPVTKHCDCRPQNCRKGCSFWAKDAKGCDMCFCAELCKNEDCPKGTLCSNVTNGCDCDEVGCPPSTCPHGFETDVNDCEVCICKEAPICTDCSSTTKKSENLWNRFKNWFD